MSRVWMWFFFSCKRYVYKGAFLVILLLLPVGAFWLQRIQKKEPGGIRIAVCVGEKEKTSVRADEEERLKTNENAGLEQALVEALASPLEQNGLFLFYECENEQQVKDEVASRRAECGYVIEAGLKEKLDQRDYKRTIRVYSAPSTIAAQLSSEIVFAAMIKQYDQDLFVQYIRRSGEGLLTENGREPGDRELLSERARQLYDKWKENGSTFHFTYEMVGQEGVPPEDSWKGDIFPVRGIVAVYVFVAGIYGAAMGIRDEKKGLFLRIPYGSRALCRAASMAAPVFLAAVSGLAAVWSGNCGGFWIYELAVMTGYGMAVVLFSWGVGVVCRREALVCCLIPFFLVGSLVFCPVFLDIGKYMPEFRMWGRLFLPGYYIRMF